MMYLGIISTIAKRIAKWEANGLKEYSNNMRGAKKKSKTDKHYLVTLMVKGSDILKIGDDLKDQMSQTDLVKTKQFLTDKILDLP